MKMSVGPLSIYFLDVVSTKNRSRAQDMSTTLQVPPPPSFSYREVLDTNNLGIHESTVHGFWAWGIILRFLRLEVSTFVFAFLQNAIHEKT
jgi:hypothetical protein